MFLVVVAFSVLVDVIGREVDTARLHTLFFLSIAGFPSHSRILAQTGSGTGRHIAIVCVLAQPASTLVSESENFGRQKIRSL